MEYHCATPLSLKPFLPLSLVLLIQEAIENPIACLRRSMHALRSS